MRKLAIIFTFMLAMLASMSPMYLGAYTDRTATQAPGDFEVDDLKLDGGDIVDTGENVRVTLDTSSPHITLTGNVATSGGAFTVFAATAPRTGSVVGAFGSIAQGSLFLNTTSGGLCHSTGTVQSSIVASTAPTTACD